MDISQEKRELRKNILKIRKDMDLNKKIKFDNIIQNRFFKSEFYIKSKDMFIYISYDSEINTKIIIEKALKDGKNVYVPRTHDKTKTMDAVKIISLNTLVKDKHGILEPTKDKVAVNPDEIDLIVIPGVAFDKTGGRMGYGAGFYDRYLNKISKSVNKIALAYDFQVIDKVPVDIHDISIDYIFTEKQNIKCSEKLRI